MTIQDLGSLGELIAAIATLVTLVYLALQLRDNTRIGRFDAHLKTRQLNADAHRILSDPDAARLWRVGLSDPDALGEDERVRFNSILYLVVNSIDARFEYRRATLDPKAYEPQGNILDDLASQPGFRRWWKLASRNYSADTHARVEESLRRESAQGGSANPRPLF